MASWIKRFSPTLRRRLEGLNILADDELWQAIAQREAEGLPGLCIPNVGLKRAMELVRGTDCRPVILRHAGRFYLQTTGEKIFEGDRLFVYGIDFDGHDPQ